MSEITEGSGTEVNGKNKAGKPAAKRQTKTRSVPKAGDKSGPVEVVAVKSKAEYARYASLEVRQKAVERSKRAIYAHLNKVTNAHINLAVKGNCQSAKFLFEFAGIDDLAAAPALGKARAGVSNSSAEVDDDPTQAVLSFYKKLDMQPPRLKPPQAAEAVEADADAEFAV